MKRKIGKIHINCILTVYHFPDCEQPFNRYPPNSFHRVNVASTKFFIKYAHKSSAFCIYKNPQSNDKIPIYIFSCTEKKQRQVNVKAMFYYESVQPQQPPLFDNKIRHSRIDSSRINNCANFCDARRVPTWPDREVKFAIIASVS